MFETEKEQKQKLEIERLRARLLELEETVASICIGSADTILVSTVEGEKVYALKTAEQPYRLFVEGMNQGAVLLSDDDTILYCNQAFADMVKTAAEMVVGQKIQKYLAQACRGDFEVLLQKSRMGQMKREQDFSVQVSGGSLFGARFSFSQIRQEDFTATCLVVIPLI